MPSRIETDSAASVISEARRRAGLTQQQLADLASTSQSAVAAYESGKRQPTLPVLRRLVHAAGFSVVVDLAARSDLLRLSDLGMLLRDQPDEATRNRLVFEFLRGAAEAGEELVLLINSEPLTAGDRRYDALLAALGEHLAVHRGLPVPAWTQDPDRFLPGFWWMGDLPSARAQALAHAPASFRRRGVLLDRHDLEAA